MVVTTPGSRRQKRSTTPTKREAVDIIDEVLEREPIDLRTEATPAAEEQLAEDRTLVRIVLPLLAEAITNRDKKTTAYLLAEITWLEHRLTQTEMQHVALWCRECAKDGDCPSELPGRYWMVWECLEHAEEQLQRSAKSWERSLFA